MTEKETAYLPVNEIARHLPIRPGDVLWLTADLTRLAFAAVRNEGRFSADSLIDGFQELLTSEGTLIIPAFNHDLKKNDRFDARSTRPMTGALAWAALKRDDFRRTQHPLHSFLVWGRDAEKLLQLDNKSSFGPDSPFGFMLRQDAKMLMIGTGVSESFTFVHFVEEEKKVRYREYRKYKIDYISEEGESGSRHYTLFAKKPGWTMDMEMFSRHLGTTGLLKEKKINGVSFAWLGLREACEVLRSGWISRVARFDKYLFIKDMVKKLTGSR